jgi:putative endonuclease
VSVPGANLQRHEGTPLQIYRKNMPDWYLYLIRCRDGSLYTGITTDVIRRFAQHQGKCDSGAKYLRGREPLELVFQKKLGSRSLALGVENKVKKLAKARKEELIRTDTGVDDIIKQFNAQLSV